MYKKIIISTLILSLILGCAFFLFQREPFISKQIPVSHHYKMFMDEEEYSSTKTKEDYKLIEDNYKKNIKSSKKGKEKSALTIKYIRDLGFEVDEEKETVQVLKYIKGSERTTVIDYMYSYNVLDFNTLLELNDYSDKVYKLKLPNPMGSDFIIDCSNLLHKDGNMIIGTPNILLENGKYLSSYDRNIAYSNGMLILEIIESENFKNLNFKYKGSIKEKGNTLKKVDLSVDLDPNTGKKRYVELIID